MSIVQRVFFAIFVSIILMCISCSGSTANQVARVTIVSTGSLVQSLHAQNQRIYRETTDRLRLSLRSDAGTVSDYDRLVAPIDRAFRQRSAVIASSAGTLRLAASIHDSIRQRGSVFSLRDVASELLQSLRVTLEVISDESIMPAVAVPQELIAIVRSLEGIASGSAGALPDAASE